jgi:hypothetical protein
MNGNPLTPMQRNILIATATPMAAIGIAGGISSFYNFRTILASDSFALSVVLAGEGATLVCALVIVCLTLLGQHSPKAVRAGLWLLPMTASVSGALLATTVRDAIVMAVAPLAMTVAGEGTALVARRVVAFQTGTDLEQQRRGGRLLWHSNRAANGGAIGKRLSKAAVWRLTRQFAETDAQLGVQLGEVLRYRITEGADTSLAVVLAGGAGTGSEAAVRQSERPAVPAPPVPPALPVRVPGAALAPVLNPEVLRQEAAGRMATRFDAPATILDPKVDDNWDFISGVLGEAEARVAADPDLKLMTVADVATMRGVNPGTVRSWVHRNKLAVADRGPKGEALFSPVDVARLV